MTKPFDIALFLNGVLTGSEVTQQQHLRQARIIQAAIQRRWQRENAWNWQLKYVRWFLTQHLKTSPTPPGITIDSSPYGLEAIKRFHHGIAGNELTAALGGASCGRYVDNSYQARIPPPTNLRFPAQTAVCARSIARWSAAREHPSHPAHVGWHSPRGGVRGGPLPMRLFAVIRAMRRQRQSASCSWRDRLSYRRQLAKALG